MCKLKSAIVLKNRIFVPDYDSHTKMLEELGIKDDYLNASKTFVRVELSPKNGDVFSDIDTWELDIDQDIVPDWFDKKTYKPQIVDAIKGWAKDNIHIGIDNLKISYGEIHYIKDCTNVTICDSAKVKYIGGYSTVKYICGYSTVEYIGSYSTVENICGSATVGNICGSATVENIYGSATVEKADGSCVIIGSKKGWEKKDTLILAENATFKDCEAKTIYQAGDWKLVNVKGGKNNE